MFMIGMFEWQVNKLTREFADDMHQFMKEGFAMEAGSTQITQQVDDEFDRLELKDKFSSFGIWLRPGYEKHFDGTKRLSPYIGGELIIGWHTSTFKSESQSAAEIQETISKNFSTSDRFSIGIGALAGLDFYIAQNLFLGLEFNYSIQYYKLLDEKFTNVGGEETISKRGSGFNFRPNAYAIFRIGYLSRSAMPFNLTSLLTPQEKIRLSEPLAQFPQVFLDTPKSSKEFPMILERHDCS